MKSHLYFKLFFIWLIAITLVVGGVSLAGSSLIPPGEPSVTFYTLSDIYSKLTNNINTNTEGGHGFSPINSPAGTFATLKEIYEAIPVISSSTILTGNTYMGIGGNVILPSASDVKANISYGPGSSVTGSYVVPPPPTVVWANSDEAGLSFWQAAVNTCAAKNTGGYTWRLPTSYELNKKYVDNGGTPAGFATAVYWSGTVYPSISTDAYCVGMNNGDVGGDHKLGSNSYHVRCVHD